MEEQDYPRTLRLNQLENSNTVLESHVTLHWFGSASLVTLLRNMFHRPRGGGAVSRHHAFVLFLAVTTPLIV
jgi:hypothetical protein